jgi:transposase
MREHAERHLYGFTGVLQADAFAGFNRLYVSARRPRPLVEAACGAHARRKLFVLADVAAKACGRLPVLASLALTAVKRIDAIFAIEREINGLDAAAWLAARRERTAGLVTELETWMRAERARLSRHADVARAFDDMLKRWAAFERIVHDRRICLTNNAAERALRGIALGRKDWLFAGSDRGGGRAAVMYTLIQTARLNGVDPQAWLTDVLARINDHPARQLKELLPWNWTPAGQSQFAP